jgi:hypothetical protein
VKNLIILCAILLITLPLVVSCRSDNGGIIPIPTKNILPTHSSQEAADDVMTAPGLGPQYRANMHEQGKTNPWPPLEMTFVTLGESPGAAIIGYRKDIETRAGEVRNNIIKVSIISNDLDSVRSLSIYAQEVPGGITLTDGMQWSGPMTRVSVLVIDISGEVASGQYTFKIGLKINDKDYGTVLCTVKVVE